MERSHGSPDNSLEIDIRGRMCPAALLIALREINAHQQALRNGALALTILTDHRDSTGTIPEAARNMGYRVTVEKISGHYRITILIGSPQTGEVAHHVRH